MKRTSKRVIAFLLTLVLMLSLCACAQMKQLWAEISVDGETPPGKHDKKPPEKPRPGAGGSDAQPAQAGFSEEAEQSLAWLRDRIDFPQTMFGAAYLGYVEEDSGGDWLSAADQAMLEAYPFLAEIDENHIIGSTGYLYCIVPVDENASVSINRMQWNEKTKTYENTEVCYRSESGEPVLLFANLDGVAYEADTQVWITDNRETPHHCPIGYGKIVPDWSRRCRSCCMYRPNISLVRAMEICFASSPGTKRPC